MAGETVITIVGNLTADPELRYTQGGLAVANLTVASTPRSFDKASNDWKDGDPLFMRCSVWREFAEHVAGSLTKGARVVVTGRLVQRSYETKEGEKRTSMELEIDEIGPSLKYATAQVTKAQSNANQSSNQQRAQQQRQPQRGQQQQPKQTAPQNDEPWANGPGSPSGGDVWNTPGNYSDETPF